MPKVNGKDFPYTEEGIEQAEVYAESQGKEVEYPTYDASGRVKQYHLGGNILSGRDIKTPLNPNISSDLEDTSVDVSYKKGGKVKK